jgi:hypothetical protein
VLPWQVSLSGNSRQKSTATLIAAFFEEGEFMLAVTVQIGCIKKWWFCMGKLEFLTRFENRQLAFAD